MAAKTSDRAPSACRECARWDELKDQLRVLELLETAISKMQTKLEADDFKPSIGDYLKLMQMKKEFDQEEAKEIKVTWVETIAESEFGK